MVFKIQIYINLFANKIINHKAFEAFCITVIIANSIQLGMQDPLQVAPTKTD
jgi:hypothetical protein